MRVRQQQQWQCLRRHTNEVEAQRCDVCGLPWWLTWRVLAGAGVVALLAGFVLLALVSRGLKEWQYTVAVRKCLKDDGQISVSERKALDDLRIYLGMSLSRSQELENKLASKIGPCATSSVECKPTIDVELQRIREGLEQGRFGDARKSLTTLHAEHPDHQEIRTLLRHLDIHHHTLFFY